MRCVRSRRRRSIPIPRGCRQDGEPGLPWRRARPYCCQIGSGLRLGEQHAAEIAAARVALALLAFGGLLLGLLRIARRLEAELVAVPGIGPAKIARYGEAFLRVLRDEVD